MLTILFVNGEYQASDMSELLQFAQLIIAVDGGANHCHALGIVPNILLGDLDSVNPEYLQNLEKHGTEIRRFPQEKDATDLELALDLACHKGSDHVILVGALGGRWDMSFSNLFLLAHDKYRNLTCTIKTDKTTLHVLRPYSPFALHGAPGSQVSFLPLKGDVTGLCLRGFLYPLENATLPFGSSRGLSNIQRHRKAWVEFSSGVLLCCCNF